jgi:indole-3-glycerol phosphate synthase/phosphoribosylanthranilate isomerase/anthranilate synthase/indole-3-glycerol phosphate synthase/phosphoribosylanthranilate isomerase
MEALVEVHNADELESALRSGAKIVGINNRDLHTFSVDIQTTLDLLERIPDEVVVVSESGIRNHRDRQRLDGQVDAILVGTSILKFPDVGLKIHELFMDRPLVKVCGIQDLETAQFCEEQGVELLGFNFVKESPRFIELEDVRVIRSSLTKSKSVGLFRDESVEFVNKTAEALDLDFVQLHGKEDEAYCSQIQRPVIKSFLAGDTPFLGVIPLIDLPKGSSGVITLETQPSGDYFLAGGLDVSNVKDVLEEHQPFVVDVARGVETEGRKDFQKIQQFINQL